MGKPGGANLRQCIMKRAIYSDAWGTRGTETSKYPEEEKETSIT
jgi:hypothetical protein